MLAYSDFLFRGVHAMGLGAASGVERQWRQRLAGLRTNMLVSPSSALFIALALRFAPPQNPSPLRVVAHIISGIGFLGAGVTRKAWTCGDCIRRPHAGIRRPWDCSVAWATGPKH